MRLELEPQDLENIAMKVAEILKPLLASMSGKHADDTIFDVQGVANYLGVSPSWVYKKVSFKEIPYSKVGRHTKFRKSQIDKWMEKQSLRAVPA